MEAFKGEYREDYIRKTINDPDKMAALLEEKGYDPSLAYNKDFMNKMKQKYL